MLTLGSMSGKVALITGAAAGLGKATSLKLAQAGANVSLLDINEDGLQQTASEILALDPRAQTQVIDLSNTDLCSGAVDAVVKEFGRLDALCNVAVVMIPSHSTAISDSEPDPSLLGRISPLRGLVEIDDVAEMVAFLATDAARGYHGACINIDNGITVG